MAASKASSTTGASDDDIREQLAEALATIDAIRNGDVDAVIVGGPEGQRVFTLDNVDRPYRVIIEQMQEGAITLSSDGLVLYCNKRFAVLAEADAQSLIGHPLADLFEDSSVLTQLLRDGGSAELALRTRQRSVPINLSVVQLAGEADAQLRCAVVTDLSQIKARQAEVLAARDRLAAEVIERRRAEDGLTFALNAADMGSWDLDLVTGRARRSLRHDEIFGYPKGAEAWSLALALDHFIEEDREQVAAAFATAELTGELDFEHRIRRASDGVVRWLHARGQAILVGGKPTRIAGVVADVTGQRLLDEQIRQVQKMDAVGQLTGGIAHDFNNLLTIIMGNIDMAERSLDADDTPRARRAVGNAFKGAERAAILTQRLLAFSRRTALAPKIIDVNRLVTGMADLFDRSLGETVELETVTGAGLWPVEADPNQLENALLNLAVNARDAMLGGGRLTIETQNMRIDEGYAASHSEVSPGEYVSIAVTDTGSGMPPDVVAKAFDPFFTTKEVGRGTGLGLSQVYGYIKQTGGHVKIYSESGQGTTIRIYLPRSVVERVDDGPSENHEGARGSAAETILVVEDDDDVRTYTVESLRELGYRVLEAHDGPSALRLMGRQDTPIKLLFTDVVMPGMSGRELRDAALEVQPGLKALFTTGYARSAIVHGGRLDAGVELLPKPFTFVDLAAKIRDVLDKGARNRILVVDRVDNARRGTIEIAASLGLSADPAATVREGLSRLRAAGGHYDAVLIDADVGNGDLERIVEEFRVIRRDLPILLTASNAPAKLRLRFQDDHCADVMARPFDAENLRVCLRSVQIHCAGTASDT